MGKFFLMSRRFDKTTAQDFGMVPAQEGYAINPADNSLWKRTACLLCVLLCFITVIFMLSGCDSGLKYVKMEVCRLPGKTTYIVGEDAALSFDGGQIKLTTLDGHEEIRDMQTYAYQDEGRSDRSALVCYISSDVSFRAAGRYTVTVWQTKELFCQFEVEVKNPE